MKITNIRIDVVAIAGRNNIFVRVETDNDLVGLGETVLNPFTRTVEASFQDIADYLVGRDALAIEDHFEKLYRDTRWVGGPLHSAARSAVDIALWDIKGQYYHAPIYQMLGGPTRPRVPMYAHVANGASPAQFVANLESLIGRGYVGAKTGMPLFYNEQVSSYTDVDEFVAASSIDPSLKETEYLPFGTFKRMAEWFSAAREAIGWEFELMLDCDGRLNVSTAMQLVETLRPFNLLFVEEPLPTESAADYGRLARMSPIPIAAGERLTSIYDVRPFMEAGALAVLQCDLVTCGGFTGARKIAALAEAHYVPLAPHNPNGPVATLAAGHLMSAIPNAYLLETVGTESMFREFAEVVHDPPAIADGFLTLTDRPGIGTTLVEDAPLRRPRRQYLPTR